MPPPKALCDEYNNNIGNQITKQQELDDTTVIATDGS